MESNTTPIGLDSTTLRTRYVIPRTLEQQQQQKYGFATCRGSKHVGFSARWTQYTC